MDIELHIRVGDRRVDEEGTVYWENYQHFSVLCSSTSDSTSIEAQEEEVIRQLREELKRIRELPNGG